MAAYSSPTSLQLQNIPAALGVCFARHHNEITLPHKNKYLRLTGYAFRFCKEVGDE